MKISDMKDMTIDQLNDEVLKLQKEQLNLRLQKTSGQLDKPLKLRDLRRNIARLETALTQLRNKAQQDQEKASSKKDEE